MDCSIEADLLEKLFRERHSCRAYLAGPVPHGVIRRILDMASRTASDCNSQPWEVVLVGGGALERLRTAMYDHASAGAAFVADIAPNGSYHGLYQERRRACGWALYEAVGIAKGDRSASQRQALENFRFFGAPHLAIISADATLGPRAAIDCGAYLMSFLLAAEALGVAAVPQASPAYYADLLRAHLGIAGDRAVFAGIAFGYEDKAHPANAFRTERASLSEIVRFVD
ncbi:MAG: nitroreductase [Aquamicrobium sp.]|uniref:nitroreductase n=1 Tax=Aquamicrobium sp. TaxID=1872579 RepID=UPI00349EC219|nr:nitroreductase [Aquamicrobium sp.]MCO5159252.1 nitroreductase [Aquamicrobium sp.]